LALLFFAFIALLVSGTGLGLGPTSAGRAYQSLTQRFGGTYQRNFFRRPNVRFRYGPTWVTIAPGPKRGQTRSTRAHLVWPDRNTYLDVETYSQSEWEKTLPRASGLEVTTGDHDFDQRFRVTGHAPSDIKKLLSDGVRWQINKLYQHYDWPYLHISISNARLMVEKPVFYRRSEELEQFTQLCLELFDQAMLTRSEGIEFMGSSHEAQLVEDPVCQVCGETIETDMVFCRRCRTPHHLDCWQYTGCCSVYGCRETRYAVPTVAEPLHGPQDQPNREEES
jgi:hypothetical protein